jgi:hypothetical protein
VEVDKNVNFKEDSMWYVSQRIEENFEAALQKASAVRKEGEFYYVKYPSPNKDNDE